MNPGDPAPVSAVPRRFLGELAAAGVTGALYVSGRPAATLYLTAGRVSYAQSPAVPDVGTALTASGRLSPHTWQTTLDAGRAGDRVGRLLVEHGHLTRGELEQRVLTTIRQVAAPLLRQGLCPLRFVAGDTHWFGAVVAVDVSDLRRETGRRRPRAAGASTGVPGASGSAARRYPVSRPRRPVADGAAGAPERTTDVAADAVPGLPRRRPGARLPGGERGDTPVHTAPDELLLTRIRSALQGLR